MKTPVKLTKNDLEFIKHVKAHCKELGVKCDIRNTSYVRYGKSVACSGWFDSDAKELVVAINSSTGFQVLVHEYGHLTQWQDGIKLWDKGGLAMGFVDIWLAGFTVKNIKRYIAIARDLELDNEKRSVKLIKKWNLSIDTQDYIKRANAYVQFYNWLPYTRKWSSPKNSPYKNQNVLNVMSSRFNMNYKKMSKKVFKTFSQENI
jgi:hypothetical protein